MADEYEHLKASLADGAWIYGIEQDGKLHRIENPGWSCPPDRYIALVPFLSSRQEVAPVASGHWSADEIMEATAALRGQTTTGQTSDSRDAG